MKIRVAVRIGQVAALGVLLGGSVASASGIFFPENGSEILGRGGADVGFLDSSYALQFNPAGMALSDGLDVHVDMMLINAGESFTPYNTSINPQNATVSSKGPSPGPMAMISYRPPRLRMLAFGIGIWAPPGALSYQFPAEGPQRYSLISQNSIVLYPSVGIAYRPIKYISFGGTLEYVYSSTSLTEASEGLPSQDTGLFTGINPNTPSDDVTAKLNVNNQNRADRHVSGLFGMIVQPIDNLIIAGSFQLYQPIDSQGTLALTPSPELSNGTSGVGLTVPTNPASATLAINLPPIARAGASYTWRRLHVSAEYVWEGWGVNNQFTPTTTATISSTVISPCKGSATADCIPAKVTIAPVENDWHNTNGFRGGLGYDILSAKEDNGFGLQVNIGAAYDPNAVPYETQTLPYITGNIIGASAGVVFDWKGFGISGSFMYDVSPPQGFTVTNSIQYRQATVPDVNPQNIGNGTYQTNDWVVGFGLHYHWDQPS